MIAIDPSNMVWSSEIGMLPELHLDPSSDAPLYRQLSDSIKELIGIGRLEKGERLPATRELAGILGLNRATVSAAYALLESEGLGQGDMSDGAALLSARAGRRVRA